MHQCNPWTWPLALWGGRKPKAIVWQIFRARYPRQALYFVKVNTKGKLETRTSPPPRHFMLATGLSRSSPSSSSSCLFLTASFLGYETVLLSFFCPSVLLKFIYLFTIQVFHSILSILDRSRKKKKQTNQQTKENKSDKNGAYERKVIKVSINVWNCIFKKQPANWTMLCPLGVCSIL